MRCNQIFKEEHEKYVAKVREKLKKSRPQSKRWWKLSRELMDKYRSIDSLLVRSMLILVIGV